MLGQVRATLERANHMELAIGTKTRSAGQFDIWEAVYRSENVVFAPFHTGNRAACAETAGSDQT